MNIIQHPSPNFRKGRPCEIYLVVLHATATEGIKSPMEWLCNPASKVSSHYLIDTDGTVYQLVDEADTAWHAGVSMWKSQVGVNAFSIGIELVHPNDGVQRWAPAQVQAAAKLCALICKNRRLGLEDIVGHCDVSPGRKDDPLDFPWVDFRNLVRKEGVC